MSGDPNGWDRDDYWATPHRVRRLHRLPSPGRTSERGEREFDEDREVERAERDYEKWLDEIGGSR